MQILQGAIDKIQKLFERPKTYLNFLDEKEFNELLHLMRFWYRHNGSFDDLLKRKNKNFLSLMQKIKRKSQEKLPNKLYRGLHWRTKKPYENFVKNLENGKYSPTTVDSHSSWTTSKKVAKKFSPSGDYGKGWNSKYGVLLEINPRDFKENIVFSTEPLYKTQSEINIFLRLMLDEHYQAGKKALELNKPNIEKMNHSLDSLQGSIFSTEEKEYILKNPTKNIDKIKYTVEEKK